MLREIRVRNLTNSLFGHMGLTYVDGGKDCTDNVTNFDYDRVRLGSSVSRSSRSPWYEKVYGVPCHEAQCAPQPAVGDVRHRLGDLHQRMVRRLDLGSDVERPLASPAGKVQAVVEQPGAAPVAPGGGLADDAVLGVPRAERHVRHDQRVVRELSPQQRLETGPIGDARRHGSAGRRPVAVSRRRKKAATYSLK